MESKADSAIRKLQGGLSVARKFFITAGRVMWRARERKNVLMFTTKPTKMIVFQNDWTKIGPEKMAG